MALKHLIIITKKKKWIVAKNERHWNTTWAFKYCWCCVKENQKILQQKKKKKKSLQKKKKKYKAALQGEEGVFIIEKLARDITERCKLPKAIEFRKKIGFNHDEMMIWEETSIAEKLIKLFYNESIVINKIFNNRNQIFGLKIVILLLKLMKEIIKIMSQMMKKKKNTCLKNIILKLFDVVQMILASIFINL